MNDVNSREYWEERFNTNWENMQGNEQTRYFASLLCEMLPDWIVSDINQEKDTICDLGCAEGDALGIYRQVFLTSQINGEDFSENAIAKAKEKYPEFNFKVGDIMSPDSGEKYPVIICSNVVEHFKDTYKVLNNICCRALKYAIIMIPYREALNVIDEHERCFYTKDIPMHVGDYKLIYANSSSCNPAIYMYEQILLVYSNSVNYSRLSEIVENVSSDREKAKDVEIQILQDIMKEEKKALVQLSDSCQKIASGKLMKLNHFISRLSGQFFHGDRVERKAFVNWLCCHIRKANIPAEDDIKYNPWIYIAENLRRISEDELSESDKRG